MREIFIAACLLLGYSVAHAATEASVTTQTVDILALLREFGFPIFVCVWFMWRLEKRLERITTSIEKLYTVTMVLTKANEEAPSGQSLSNND